MTGKIEQYQDAPSGCLACNRDEIAAYLEKCGYSPDWFLPVPRPRHNWRDVVCCQACGAAFLLNKPREEKNEP